MAKTLITLSEFEKIAVLVEEQEKAVKTAEEKLKEIIEKHDFENLVIKCPGCEYPMSRENEKGERNVENASRNPFTPYNRWRCTNCEKSCTSTYTKT